jgi:hypothetical protein
LSLSCCLPSRACIYLPRVDRCVSAAFSERRSPAAVRMLAHLHLPPSFPFLSCQPLSCRSVLPKPPSDRMLVQPQSLMNTRAARFQLRRQRHRHRLRTRRRTRISAVNCSAAFQSHCCSFTDRACHRAQPRSRGKGSQRKSRDDCRPPLGSSGNPGEAAPDVSSLGMPSFLDALGWCMLYTTKRGMQETDIRVRLEALAQTAGWHGQS